MTHDLQPAPLPRPLGRGPRPQARWAVIGVLLVATALAYCDGSGGDADYVWKARAELSRGRLRLAPTQERLCLDADALPGPGALYC